MTLHGILSKTHYEHQEVKTKISVRFKGVQSHLETPTSFDMKIFPGHPDTFELSSAAIAMLNAPMQNHSNLNMQFVVRDKFGNVTKGPGLSLEAMGSCVKSPGTGTEADLSKYSLNVRLMRFITPLYHFSYSRTFFCKGSSTRERFISVQKRALSQAHAATPILIFSS
jgi:hypothetical protein